MASELRRQIAADVAAFAKLPERQRGYAMREIVEAGQPLPAGYRRKGDDDDAPSVKGNGVSLA